jgi:hypothetical protein
MLEVGTVQFLRFIVVPELSCAICHVNTMEIAQDNSGTTLSILQKSFIRRYSKIPVVLNVV